MVTPSLEELLAKVDSKYSLVVAVAKRARQIIAESEDSDQEKAMKAVSFALADIANEKVTVERNYHQ